MVVQCIEDYGTIENKFKKLLKVVDEKFDQLKSFRDNIESQLILLDNAIHHVNTFQDSMLVRIQSLEDKFQNI